MEKMEKTGLIIAILAVFLFLSTSVVYAQPEHSESYCRVSNVDLNGQGKYLEIGAGEAIEISLDYEIWNRIGCPGCIQQIVVGLNREPLFCVYDDIPGIYPGMKGHKSSTITAPTEPGTYIVRWMCASQYTCDGAKDKYRESPYVGYGVAEIKIITKPDDLGICAKVTNIELNEQGNYLEVEVEEFFKISLDYQIWCWVEGNHRRQIMVGLDDEPFWCVYDGTPPEKPGLSRHTDVTIRIPKPGTYTLSWMITFCDTVGDGGNFYRSHPELRNAIGMIKVTESDNDVHTHYCEVIHLDLNGQGNYLEIEPGKPIRMCTYYELWNSDNCPECIQQIVVGLDIDPLYCAYNGVPGIYPGITDGDGVYEMTAPTEPGVYDVFWINTYERNCLDAMYKYKKPPISKKKIGTIKVTDGEDEDWECKHYKVVKFPDDSDLVPDSNISFWQQGHSLRVQIDENRQNGATGGGIWSGSISISVGEDTHVRYHTSNVTGIFGDIIDYQDISIQKTRDEKALLFAASFIPYAGAGISILDYCEDSEQYRKYDWTEEENLIKDSRKAVSCFFDSLGMRNGYDIIYIPWYLRFGHPYASSIRVDCPEMIFPEVDIYDIVFRVDYTIGPRYTILGGKRVRYDVMLRFRLQ